jgi:hypothetical protein
MDEKRMDGMETDLLMFDDSDGFALPGADQEGIVVGQLLLIGRCRWRRGVRLLGVVAVVGRRHDVGRQGRRVESCLHLLHCAIAVVVSVARLHHRLLLFSQLSRRIKKSDQQTLSNQTAKQLPAHAGIVFFSIFVQFRTVTRSNDSTSTRIIIKRHVPIKHSPNFTKSKIVHFATYLKSNQNSKIPPKQKIFRQSTETGTLFFNRKEKKMMKSIFFGWVGVRQQTNEMRGRRNEKCDRSAKRLALD